MNNTRLTLLEQLRITEWEINRRKELLYFTGDDVRNLRHCKPLIAPYIDTIVDEFYETQTRIEEIDSLIGDAETLARLKMHMKKYILDLFDGFYTTDYVQSRLRIGLVHKRIGVTPKLYISALYTLQQLLIQYITHHSKDENTKHVDHAHSLKKIMLFDLELVFDTYIHSLMDELNKSKDELERYATGLEEMVAQRTEELQALSRMDSLTGLFNKRYFIEQLSRELSRTQRSGQSVSLAYIDLDHFKRINDEKGHKAGDELLAGVSDVMRTTLRPSDIGARYGGDEFCLILPETNIEGAQKLCNRLIRNFDETMPECGITFSIGLAESNPENILNTDDIIHLADQAMYEAKKAPGHKIVKHASSGYKTGDGTSAELH